jgi:hypothetical protein
MTLMSLDGKKQSSTGKKDYWKSFTGFKETPLHGEIVRLIEETRPSDSEVFSSQFGARILSNIEKNNPELISIYNQSQVGSLFGMTLWHHLANLEDTWHFYKRSNDNDEETTDMVYFQSTN